ncbi:DUF3108 domain-containing protein [Candidatus Poribacteria bacterium]|nr:DUF3108 domain-containing protein [Candidatus Poribacteria bacterium]
MRIIQILFVSCFIFLTFSLAISATYSLLDIKNLDQPPIQIGEVLTYSVKIKGLPAGTQVTKVVEKTTLADRHVYRFRSERQTGSLLGKLYHFYDQTESYVTTDQLYPLKYVRNLEDQKYRARVEIDFDHSEGTAQHTKNSANKALDIPIGTQDDLSMIYFLRSKELQIGHTYAFPVIVKDKCEHVTLEILRREVIKTKALGRVETLVLRTSHDYLMWLTNDERRIPVKIEAKTPRIGKLVGVLEKVDFLD